MTDNVVKVYLLIYEDCWIIKALFLNYDIPDIGTLALVYKITRDKMFFYMIENLVSFGCSLPRKYCEKQF